MLPYGPLMVISGACFSPPPEHAAERPAGRAKRRSEESVCDALIDQVEVEPRLIKNLHNRGFATRSS